MGSPEQPFTGHLGVSLGTPNSRFSDTHPPPQLPPGQAQGRTAREVPPWVVLEVLERKFLQLGSPALLGGGWQPRAHAPLQEISSPPRSCAAVPRVAQWKLTLQQVS